MSSASPPALLKTCTNRPEEILHFCDENLMRPSTTCNTHSPCIKSPAALKTSGEVTYIIPFENLCYSDERSSLEEGVLSDVRVRVAAEAEPLSEARASLLDRSTACFQAIYQQQGLNHLFTGKQVCRKVHADGVNLLSKEEDQEPFLKNEGRTSDHSFHLRRELKLVTPTITPFNFVEGGQVNDLSAVAICYSNINQVSVKTDQSDQRPSLPRTDVVEQRNSQHGYAKEFKDTRNHLLGGLEIKRARFAGEADFSQGCCVDPEIKHRRSADYFYPNHRERTPVPDKKFSEDSPSSSCILAQSKERQISSCQSDSTDLQRLWKDTSVGDYSLQLILGLISSINKVGKLALEICVACEDIQTHLSKELHLNGTRDRCKEMGCSNSKPKSKEKDSKRNKKKKRTNQYEFDGVNAVENHLFDESQEDTPYMLSPAKSLAVEKSDENPLDENGNASPTSKATAKHPDYFSMFVSVLTEEVWTLAMAQLKEIVGQQKALGTALPPPGAASDVEPEIDASDIGIELQDDSQQRPRVDEEIEVDRFDDPLQKTDQELSNEHLALNVTLHDNFENSDDNFETGDDNIGENGLFKMTEVQREFIGDKERIHCDLAAYLTHLSDAIFAEAMLALFFGRQSNGTLESIEAEEYWINSMITWSGLSSLNTRLHLGLVEDGLQQKLRSRLKSYGQDKRDAHILLSWITENRNRSPTNLVDLQNED